MPRDSERTAGSPRVARRFAVAFTALLVLLTGCSSGAEDRVLVEGRDWQLAVGSGPELQFRDGDSSARTDRYTRPVALDESSTFLTSDGTTLFAGPVSDDAAKVTVATTDGGESPTELVVSHGLTWFWVQLPGELTAAGFVAHDAAGAVVDAYTAPASTPDAILVDPHPL